MDSRDMVSAKPPGQDGVLLDRFIKLVALPRPPLVLGAPLRVNEHRPSPEGSSAPVLVDASSTKRLRSGGR